MKISRLPSLPDVMLLSPQQYADERGRFMEAFRVKELLGEDAPGFTQGNLSFSVAYTIRGLHYQSKDPQGKLMRAVSGRIVCAAVDMREGSATLGKWATAALDDRNCEALWIPPGFAAGFLAFGGPATVYYDCSSYYDEHFNHAIRFDDSDIGIAWPLEGRSPIISPKDRMAGSFRDAVRVVP